MKCGWCGSEDVYYETVDNGVGLQQIEPAQCQDCGAGEIDWRHLLDNSQTFIEPEDFRRGWYAGPESEALAVPPPSWERVHIKNVLRPRDTETGVDVMLCWAGTTHVGRRGFVSRDCVFKTICGLVFEDADRPTNDVITCLWCAVGVEIGQRP